MAILAITCIVSAVVAPYALAQGADGEHGDVVSQPRDMASGVRVAGIAIGAAIALVGGAISTCLVQSAVCAGGVGALVEKRDMLPVVIILLAIPETLVILGFVVAIMIINLN